ncbi:MAG: hypothetical protein ACYDCO_07655 [Armatimonadota bacterium]
MGKWNYVHADRVLPAALVKEIRQYVTGLIYIPVDQTITRHRTAIRVCAMKEQGFRNCEIARILGITPRRVCGILQRSAATTTTSTSPGHEEAVAP